MSTSLGIIGRPRREVPITLPIQEGNVSRTGLTSAQSDATLGIAPFDALYRISASVRCTTGGDAITVTLNVKFTDDVGAATFALVSAFSLTLTGRTGAVYEFRAQRNTQILWNTTLSGARVASKYALDVAIERLT